jgi:hypothetical protein
MFIASQASSITQYKNTKTKLMKCCTNIYFNRQCLIKKITPKYANCKIPQTSPASKDTQIKVKNIRVKDEIKFLCAKKQQLNKNLYNIHLKAVHEWANMWHTISNNIQESINQEATKNIKH